MEAKPPRYAHSLLKPTSLSALMGFMVSTMSSVAIFARRLACAVMLLMFCSFV